ncbi:DNA binding protein, putative [Ricinus communis]|uniref:DNA binding protein, putative n=1 Tax=Ricinus communis TaxID=3988 RepID=B9SYL2_RICCO|nr:DNA binding protein, putative [Ricinus communis]|eukprot:XP_015582026.1 glutamic acid-rich protein [Ricinus communis]
MSRCFPFPPPGYEKKARVDDTDLLKKEKHKEKKHKKDKKDKEKREGKEKRDKDRSKEKHREKKDRKETHKDKDRDREKNGTSDEKKVEGQSGYHNGEKFGSNSQQNSVVRDSACVEELARRIKDEDRASGSQMVQKVDATDQKRSEVRGSISIQSQEKEKIKNKNEDQRKINGQKNHFDTRVLEKAFGQTSFGMDQERVEGIVRLVEKKDTEKQMEGKEKNKQKENDGKGDKHKVKDREKIRKSKDKNREKEEKKENSKEKEITKPSKEQPKLKDNVSKLKEGSKDSLDFRNIKSPERLKLSNVSLAAEGNLGKRKELERNGFLLENGNRPNKFPRPVSSSHSVVENGKKLEPCKSAVQFASEKQELVNNHKVYIKEQKVNGFVTAEHKINGLIPARSHISSTKSLSVGVQANENGETFSKPPHPDTKYLSQILSIPEMEELPDVDDQEWLLSYNHLQSKKPTRGSPGIDGIRQVWAEAFRIESADISALPYVIPY